MNVITGGRIFYWGLLVLFLLFSLTGCYEPVEGCLDVSASNFKLDADQGCSDCCIYPFLKLDIQHKYVKGSRIDNLVFSDSVYHDVNGRPFVLKSIRFFLSDLHLIRSDGSVVGVEDKLELGIWKDNLDTVHVQVEDNFSLIDPDQFGTLEIGTIRTSGKFDRLRFTIGLKDIPNRTVVNGFPEDLLDHPLALEDMYWDFDRGYIFNRIELLRDTISGTPSTILEIGTMQHVVNVELPIDYEAIEGFNIRVRLRIDYGSWFKNIDVKQDSDAALIQKIVANLPDSFSLIAIDF